MMVCKNVKDCRFIGYCPRRTPHKEQYGCEEESYHSKDKTEGCVTGSTCVECKGGDK